MLKVFILAAIMLITGVINSILGILGMLGNAAADFLQPANPVTQSQPFVQQTVNRQKNIKTNLKSLPKNQYGETEQANSVMVSAGDKGVAKQTVKSALGIVENFSLPILRDNLNLSPKQEADIVLFSSKSTYANALLKAGVDSKTVSALVTDSGGVTVGSEVWIPLYALQDRAYLANVLTHELTHVVFNQNRIGDQLPTWINEGTAWYNGLAAQTRINSSETKREMAELQNEVVAAGKSGSLYPLSANEQDIINAPYNIEYEDYLAVNYLIQHYGKSTFQVFLANCSSQGVDRSFQAQYKMGLKPFETSVYQALQKGQ